MKEHVEPKNAKNFIGAETNEELNKKVDKGFEIRLKPEIIEKMKELDGLVGNIAQAVKAVDEFGGKAKKLRDIRKDNEAI